MRIIEKKVYTFDELDERAKEKAREWMRDGYDYSWTGEVRDTLKAFESAFPVTAKDWQYGPGDYQVTARYTGDDNAEELTGLRLRTYLINNYGRILTTAKTIRKGWQGKSRKSKCQKEDNACPFTGVCFDESALAPIRKFIKKPDNSTFSELLAECLDSLFADASNDWEYQLSDEAIDETILANGYEFDEDGNRE